ncbi:hypothetical protein MAR_036717 [Mya arenaria]|uniref:Uncharacterized protein n=1 Tax=Mya arenaria TaxID=6604 RepID=A0ABY7FQQ5_MYAAR|nr:hypothetical protein MAR_036717 [Mya arenaria]
MYHPHRIAPSSTHPPEDFRWYLQQSPDKDDLSLILRESECSKPWYVIQYRARKRSPKSKALHNERNPSCQEIVGCLALTYSQVVRGIFELLKLSGYMVTIMYKARILEQWDKRWWLENT